MQLKHVQAAGLLAVMTLTSLAWSAPLYKETLTVAGVFPGVSYQDALIRKVKEMGFTRPRIDLTWTDVEKAPGQFNWGFYDEVMRKVEANGLKAPIFILDYNNPLYGPKTPHPRGYQWGITTDANRAAFARFARAAAERYKGKGVIWEIWNEPDVVPFWADTPNPVDFARLVQASLAAIRSVDPQAVVINGGFADKLDKKEFIRQFLQAGGARGLNALAVHSYNTLNPPRVIEDQEGLHREFRDWMRQYNGGTVLPIIDTEFGMSTFWGSQWNRTAPNDVRAKRYVRFYLSAYYDGVFMSSVYGLNDTLNGQLGDFQLYTESPMTKALVYTNKLLADYEGSNQNWNNPNIRVISFKTRGTTTGGTDPNTCQPVSQTTGQKEIIALWSTKGRHEGTLPRPINVEGVFDVYGNRIVGAQTLTRYVADEGVGPVFLVVRP